MKTLFTYFVPAGLAGLLVAVPAPADGCRAVQGRGFYPAPVVTAAHGHGYAHPYAVPVAVIPSTFYSVAPEIALAAVVQAAADQAARKAKGDPAEVEAAVERALLRVLQAQGPGPKPPAVPPAKNDDPGLGPPLAAGPAKDAAAAVQKVVNASCLKCHGKADDLDLTDVTRLDEKGTARMLKRVMTTGKGRMPPNGASVEGDALEAFHALALEAEKTSAK
jgi:mono/diheme cytochrome c family protein